MITTNMTQDKVRNYQGNNSFLLSMKDSLKRWGRLTPKQIEASERALNSEIKKLDTSNLPHEIKRIIEYTGDNVFVKEIADKFKKYGTLTTNQITASLKQIQREEDKSRTHTVNWLTPGETIKLGRMIGSKLKEKYTLKFNPVLIDVIKLKSVSPKAVLIVGKLTSKRGNVCNCCMKTLTDEFSMLTGMGKVCAGHMGVEYITDKSQVERFRQDYLKKIEEIGELEFWIPKSQIKKWDGGFTYDAIKSMY